MATLVVVAVAFPARAFDDAQASHALALAKLRLAATAESLPPTQSPKAENGSGGWKTVASDAPIAWTQGFFPGELWYLYEATGDAKWRTLADRWTRPLEGQKENRATHDLGFKLLPSFGHAYRLTKDPYYRDVLLKAAESLASRFNPQIGIISTGDWNPNWDVPLVVDTMMNLELLLWAADNGGPAEWREMALSHARKNLADLVRADGSTFHVVDYDRTTGAIRSQGTYQGVSDDSTWMRGQVWAVYGYTVVYRYTRDPEMLAAARKTAEFYLAHTMSDGVPLWDTLAQDGLRDTSAATGAASALLELAQYVPSEGARYRNAAHRALEGAWARRTEGTARASILREGVGNRPANEDVQVGLIYGDYYFLEAVFRLHPHPTREIWYAQRRFADAVHPLGAVTGGVVQVEFDLTLLAPGPVALGFAGGAPAPTQMGQAPIELQLIDAAKPMQGNDGSTFRAVQPYQRANETVRARLVVDLAAKKYSTWLSAHGSTFEVARDFAFRPNAANTADLRWLIVSAASAAGEGRARVQNVTVAQLPAAPTPGTPAPPLDPPDPGTAGPVDPSPSDPAPGDGSIETPTEPDSVTDQGSRGCSAMPFGGIAALALLLVVRRRRVGA